MNCPFCQRLLVSSLKTPRIDSCEAHHCQGCGASIRIMVTCLREPQVDAAKLAELKKQIRETYDAVGNRIQLERKVA